jgi:hypothetical protein
MIQINKVGLNRLQNQEKFNFISEFRELVTRYTVSNTTLSNEYNTLIALHDELSNTLEVARRSTNTAKIEVVDSVRDNAVTRLRKNVVSFLAHNKVVKADAASNIMTAFDKYGEIERRSYAAETAAIQSLVQDLRTKYLNDITTLGLQNWVNELDDANNEFKDLIKARDIENSAKPQVRTIDITRKIEKTYGEVVRCIETATIHDPTNHGLDPFLTELNIVINRYRNMLAQRKGVAAAKKKNNVNKIKN